MVVEGYRLGKRKGDLTELVYRKAMDRADLGVGLCVMELYCIGV